LLISTAAMDSLQEQELFSGATSLPHARLDGLSGIEHLPDFRDSERSSLYHILTQVTRGPKSKHGSGCRVVPYPNRRASGGQKDEPSPVLLHSPP